MTQQSKIRSFIAIEISNSVREKIANLQEELRKKNEPIRWTKPDNIHLTLKFLGDLAEYKVELIKKSLVSSAKGFQCFNLSIKNLGAFPNLRRPRVLWIGIENPDNELSKLQDSIERELDELGFPKENRKFKPHLTIGRVKSAVSEQFIERFKIANFAAEKVKIDEIILMKSELHPKGAIYTPLKKIRLE